MSFFYYLFLFLCEQENRRMKEKTKYLKFMFSKKATKIDQIFTVDLTFTKLSVKSTVKIFSIFVAFLENMNFTCTPIYSDMWLCENL